MSKKIWLELLDLDGQVKEKFGSYSNAHFMSYFTKLLDLDETGYRVIQIAECQPLAEEIYSYMTNIELPKEIDDADSIDKLGRLYIASTFVVKFNKLKVGNKRFSGYKITWG